MIGWMWIISQISIQIPAVGYSPADDDIFGRVMGQGSWIMIGSIVAFLVSQLVDVTVFHAIRSALKGRHIWARATGSTIVSQLIDSFVVIYIAFWLPKKVSGAQAWDMSTSSFIYKVGLAIALTPVIYFAHFLVVKYLGADRAHAMSKQAAGKD
jgi:queuosine precursor transporter